MQIKFQTPLFQLVARLKPLMRGAEADENRVGLFDIIDDRFIRQKLCQPSAVFGADDIFPIGKCTGSRQSLHNGARFALDACADLFGNDRADTIIKRMPFFKQRHGKGGGKF